MLNILCKVKVCKESFTDDQSVIEIILKTNKTFCPVSWSMLASIAISNLCNKFIYLHYYKLNIIQ